MRGTLGVALILLAATAVGSIGGGVAAAQGGAVAAQGGAAMPFDLAFARHQLSREDRPVLTRDGARAAYVVNQPPEKSPPDSRFQENGVPVSVVGHRVFVTEVAGGRTRAVAADGGNCWRPSWSPDGAQLAFYCDQGGMPQLWVYDVTADKARRVSDTRIKAKLWAGDEAVWSPDGREIFVPIAPPGAPSPARVLPPAAPAGSPTVTVHRSTAEAAKDAGGGGTQDHVAMLMRENNAGVAAIDLATGRARTVVAADASPPPSVLRLSPSGKWVSYLSVFHKPRAIDTVSFQDLAVAPAAGGSVRTVAADIQLSQGDYYLGTYVWHPTRDELFWWKDKKLWTLDLAAASASPRQLAASLGDIAMAPLAVTRDGTAVIAGLKPIDMRDYRDPYPQALALVPIDGKEPIVLPLPEGMVFQGVVKQDAVTLWQPSGTAVTVVARESATTQDVVLRFDPATGRPTTLWKGLARLRFSGSASDHAWMLAGFENIDTPGNLYRFNADFGDPKRITDVEPRLAGVRFGPVEAFETTVPQHDGSLAKVATAVLLPPGAKRGDRLPALVFIYPGGKVSRSAAEFGGGMPSTVPVSVFTSRGYAVLLSELPIGPDGAAGNPVDEMVDVLLAQVYRAAELGYVDIARLAVSGQSYGGYGTASVVSGTNLFRAAVAISGLYDLATNHSWMSPRGGLGARWAETGQGRMGTHPWGDLRRYLNNSPFFRADYIHTPLLMLHGEIDYTCPVEDARKLFGALKRLGRNAELRTYAGEGHVVYSWSLVNAVDATSRMLAFLDEHLKNARPAAPSAAGGVR